ncbi:MAG: hypothetical protein ACYSXF_06135 [Planctomycetota bacterium]|jgi:hypothetical protein
MDTRLPVGCVLLLAFALIVACTSWEADSPGGPGGPGIRWDEKIEVASGDAVRGPWRMNQSEFNFVDDPTVAINEQGHVGVAWADHPKQDIYFQLYAPDGNAQLEESVNVSASPNIFSWLPRMMMTSDDPIEVYLLWQEIVFSGGTHGGEIFFARSTDHRAPLAQRKSRSRHGLAGQSLRRLDRIRRPLVVQPYHRWA